MKLTSRMVTVSIRKIQGSNNMILSLNQKHIGSLAFLEEFTDIKLIENLELSTNYLKYIEDVFNRIINLKRLSLSTNCIKQIENLQNLTKLEDLDLSINRITRIENIKNLFALKRLNLSMNYIEKLENLPLPNLEILILTGNQIKYLENLDHLTSLRVLDIQKNKLINIKALGINSFPRLKVLNVAFNQIEMEELDEFILALQSLVALEDLNCTGNDITLHKHYKFQNIKILDNLELKPYIKEYLERLKENENYENLVVSAKNEYFARLSEEYDLKKNAKDMIKEQENQVDEIFSRYEQNMTQDLDNFLDFMNLYNKKKKLGENIDLNLPDYKKWKSKIELAEQERKRITEIAYENQEKTKKEYLDGEINKATLSKKLYEISMKEPDIWRDIKRKELAQNLKEEGEIRILDFDKQLNESSILEKDEFDNNLKYDMNKNVADRIRFLQARDLMREKDDAADKIQKNFRGDKNEGNFEKNNENKIEKSPSNSNNSVSRLNTSNKNVSINSPKNTSNFVKSPNIQKNSVFENNNRNNNYYYDNLQMKSNNNPNNFKRNTLNKNNEISNKEISREKINEINLENISEIPLENNNENPNLNLNENPNEIPNENINEESLENKRRSKNPGNLKVETKNLEKNPKKSNVPQNKNNPKKTEKSKNCSIF